MVDGLFVLGVEVDLILDGVVIKGGLIFGGCVESYGDY